MFYFSFHQGDLPILLHIPHSSTTIPSALRSFFVLSDSELVHEAQWMADLYTNELFPLTNTAYYSLVSQLSRLVVDMERFEDDTQETMSAYGMGALYEKTSTGEVLRQLTETQKEKHLQTIFRPYHAELNKLAQQCVDEFGTCFIIDCHSFPSVPRYYEDQHPDRPDICIGTDSVHTPQWAIEILQNYVVRNGFSVKLNTPFAGTILPNGLVADSKYTENINSIMIEVNRKLYMNEKTFEKGEQFGEMQSHIQKVIHEIAERV